MSDDEYRALYGRRESAQGAEKIEVIIPESFIGFCDWLGVVLTPAQRCLASWLYDAAPTQYDSEYVEALFGYPPSQGTVETIPGASSAQQTVLSEGVRHRVVTIVAGRRAGKSYIFIALRLLHGLLVRDLSSCAPGQIPTAIVIAQNRTLRQEVLNYALGAVRSRPELASLLPKQKLDDLNPSRFDLHRPDGRLVRFQGAVATKGGYGARGRSFTDVALDETAFFADENHAISDVRIFAAAIPGLLPGGQCIVASTPWTEAGLLYDLYKRNYGHPVDALCAHAPTVLLNPEQRELVERETLRDPDNAAVEYEAQFMPGGSSVFFPAGLLDGAIERYENEGGSL